MRPTSEQVEWTAYQRWLRRGRVHGQDREDWYAAERELLFLLNYQTIVEYPLGADPGPVLGAWAVRRCRFCERTADQAGFQEPHPVVPGPVGSGSLRTFAICDECQADCREPLAGEFQRLLSALRAAAEGRGSFESPSCGLGTLAAYKAMVASALLLLPEQELGFFPDALEWVSHPDPEIDAGLFAGSACRLYFGDPLGRRSWVSLARRRDDEMSLPYLLYFLGCDGVLIQVPIPLCLRDEDLDGRPVCVPERVFAAGEGPDYRESWSTVLPWALASGRSSRRDRPVFLGSG
jgi:hypothetical protein